jgi:P2-related tail formation protein
MKKLFIIYCLTVAFIGCSPDDSPDIVTPVITVTPGTDTVEKGSTWTDAGATADGGETVTVSGTVDTSTPGTYTITYTATDAAGNVGTATRTVTLVDTASPVITVTTGTDTVEKGSTWTDAGATADGGETVTVSGTVDTSTPGTYTITYSATDASGNTGTATRTVIVVDTAPPVITVTPGTDTVERGSTWTDAGATADGGEAITVTGTVDRTTAGTYTITYTATDAAGNVGTATRTVIVSESPTYTKVFSGLDIYDNGELYELTVTIYKANFRVQSGQNFDYSTANQPRRGSFAEQELVFWKVDFNFDKELPSTTGFVFVFLKSAVGGQDPVGYTRGGSGIAATSTTNTRVYSQSHMGSPVYNNQQITAADEVKKITIQIFNKEDPNNNPIVLDDSLLLDFNILWLD